MRFKNTLTLIMLALAAYFSLATSMPLDPTSPQSGNIYIISDCVTPAIDAVVTVSASTIIAPAGLSFTNFGFPAATLSRSMTGIVNGQSRECTVTYGENGTNEVDNRWLYTCFDDGKYRCSIFTKPQ